MTELGLSARMDTWLLVRNVELNGERNRTLYVLKSRGMAHSNQIREFVITHHGVQLVDAYLGAEGVLTGSARLAQEARDLDAETRRREELEEKTSAIERRRATIEAQIVALRSELAAEEKKLQNLTSQDAQRKKRVTAGQASKSMAALENLRVLCEEYLPGQYEVEIIDLLRRPQLARGDQIIAIPTLVRKLPEPVKKIIGDLSNVHRTLVGLDCRPTSYDQSHEASG